MDERKSFLIDMFEISKGCPEACRHCGAYERFRKEDFCVVPQNIEFIRGNIKRIADATGRRVKEILAKYVTTYVNAEPLRIPNFLEFADMIYEESGGASSVVAISHGVRANVRLMVERLFAILERVAQKKIPLFVLSVDFARSMGRISYERNFEFYASSLEILRGYLDYGRITVSLQGSDCEERMKVEGMFEEILKVQEWTSEEIAKLNVDRRFYTLEGRAKEQFFDEQSQDCPVVPDSEFVENVLLKNYAIRGMLDFEGELYLQPNHWWKGYGDSVNREAWEKIAI